MAQELHPLIYRRVRIKADAAHYPRRFGTIERLVGDEHVLVNVEPYKGARAVRRWMFELKDLTVLPKENA